MINKKNKEKKLILSIFLVAVLILILMFSYNFYQNNIQTEQKFTEESEEQKNLDFEAAKEQEKITIPAVTGLIMAAGQTHQIVDFYNPDTNNCYFCLSLYLSDDTLLYQSDYLRPSEQIKEIEILQILQQGTYKNCRLSFDCFTLDETKKPLNSGTVTLEITAR